MNGIGDKLITVGVGLALLAGTWFIWFLSGVVNNFFNTKKWSWKRMLEDIAKTFVMGLAMLAWVVLAEVLDWYTTQVGMDISALLDGASTTGLIGIICGGSGYYIMKAFRNFGSFIGTEHVATKVGEANYKAVSEATVQMVNNIVTALYTPKEAAEAHAKFEEEGGLGSVYVLDISSYDAFRKQVIGKGFDVDNYYGYQCWDGVALLWQQLGRSLLCGRDNARGCWIRSRIANAGADFELVTDVTKIKRGMVLVFSTGDYGHIGFADEDYHGGDYIRLLGQNQGGTPVGTAGGAGFNVINMSLATFLGAFAYKPWFEKSGQSPDTSTTIKPVASGQETDKSATIKKGDLVRVLKYIDVNGTLLRVDQQSTPFLVFQSSKTTRTAVLKSDDGDIYARMSWDNIQKV